MVCAFAACLAISADAKSDKSVKKFDHDFSAIVGKLDCVGGGVTVFKEGKKVYSKVFGQADRANEVKFTSSHKVMVTTVASPVPAIAVLQLCDNGKASLDADISEYLGFKIRNPKYPDTPITLRMLLDGTSSICLESISTISSLNPAYVEAFSSAKPGSKFKASSVPYVIAAAIVEKLSGERFDIYAAKHIFEPMGITASYNPENVGEGLLAHSYNWVARTSKYVNQKRAMAPLALDGYVLGETTYCVRPANGLLMSIDDLSTMLQTFMNSMVAPNGNRILSEASANEFLSPKANKGKSCLGLIVNVSAVPDYPITTISGSGSGSSAAIYFNVKDRIGMAVICNGSHDDSTDINGNVGNHFNRDTRGAFTKNFIK